MRLYSTNMQNIINNLGRSKLISLGVVLILLVLLPLVVVQVQTQQQAKQRAEGTGRIHFELDPFKLTVKKEETFNTSIRLINTPEKDISAVDLLITYPSDKLTLNSFYPLVESSGFSTIINDTSVPGKIHYVGVNDNPFLRNTSGFFIGRLTFSAKAEGVGNVQSTALVTAQGEFPPLAVDGAKNKTGSFTVDSSIALPTSITPTPKPCNSPNYCASAGECLKDRGNNLGTRTCAPDICCQPPEQINTPTPTPNPDLSSISGKYLDIDNQQLVLPNQKVTIESEDGRYVETITASPTWSFSNLVPGSYKLTVAPISGYRIFHGLCYNCSAPVRLVEGNVFDTYIPPKSYYGVHVKYLPLPGVTTPGSIPFTSSAFPAKGTVGTLFSINAKTEQSQKVKLVINGPGTNIDVDVYDDGTGDNRPKDGNYTYVFNSDKAPAGVYLATFTINGQQLSASSFEVIDIKSAQNLCVPFIKSGYSGEKIDLVVASVSYSEEELEIFKQEVMPLHINFLFSKEPLKVNKDKFNVWFLIRANEFDCAYGNGGSCIEYFQRIVSQTCAFADKIIVLDKKGVAGYAPSRNAVVRGASDPESVGVTMHEFGHAMGGLADEYEAPGGTSNTDGPNCDIFACQKWCSGKSSSEKPECGKYDNQATCEQQFFNGVKCVWRQDFNVCDYPYHSGIELGQACQENTACYYGCGGSGYRSSQYSIMGDPNFGKNREYNLVSKKQIQKEIDKYIK